MILGGHDSHPGSAGWTTEEECLPPRPLTPTNPGTQFLGVPMAKEKAVGPVCPLIFKVTYGSYCGHTFSNWWKSPKSASLLGRVTAGSLNALLPQTTRSSPGAESIGWGMHTVSQQRGLGKILRMLLVLDDLGTGSGKWIFVLDWTPPRTGVILCLGLLIHLMKKAGRMK